MRLEEQPELPELKLDIEDALERTENVDTRFLFSSFPGLREAI